MVVKFIASIIIIFPLTLMILAIVSSKVKPVSRVLKELRSSLNDYPLAEFEYANICTGKYNGNLFTIAGFKDGCSCVNLERYNKKDNKKYLVAPRRCPVNKTANHCRKVPGSRSQNLEYWEKGKFCSKYYNISSGLKGYLHFLDSSVLKNEECKNGYKKCGKLDDMDNYLCVPEGEECPITDVIVSNKERDDLKDYNFSVIDDKYFYYTNKADKQIITKLKVIEGKLCTDRTFIDTEYPQYILDYNFEYYGCRHKIDGDIYEKNFEILDSTTKKEFFNYSGISMNEIFPNYTFSDFPFYSLNAKMNLYPQRYIGYDKQCLKKNGEFNSKNSILNEEKIIQVDLYIIDVVSKNRINMWFSIVALGLSIILSVLVIIFAERFPKIFLLWGAINLIMFIMILVPIIINLTKISKFKQIPLCGSSSTNTKINFYHASSKKLKVTTILSIIFDIFYLLFNIAILFYKFFGKGKSSDDNLLSQDTNKSSNIDYNKNEEPFSN